MVPPVSPARWLVWPAASVCARAGATGPWLAQTLYALPRLAGPWGRPGDWPGRGGGGRGGVVGGPGGDFTPEEQAELVAAGATLVGLGPLRLRVETAVLAALATVRLYADGGV